MIAKPAGCQECPGWQWGPEGFVPADGSGRNGVLVVLEAAGADEAREGRPTIGKAGLFLWSALSRVGLERDDFRVHNVLSCQPPGNKLADEEYEEKVIACCAPNLDATITDMQERCRVNGKHLVIVALGKIAFKRIMGISEHHAQMKARGGYKAYVHWSERYQAWVLAADHPSFLMRGNSALVPVLQFVVRRAVEIASEGFSYERPNLLLDPTPEQFTTWVDGYFKALADDPENTFLSYDIETPYKRNKDEEEIDPEEDETFIIERVSFAYDLDGAVSVPWEEAYLPAIRGLFDASGIAIGWNNNKYDDQRVMAQVPVNQTLLDAMVAWHVLNSALPKGLGFVTPYYATRFPMWKHLSDSKPAYYNAIDALAALHCWLGIRRDLQNNALWPVFDRHVLQLDQALSYMSRQGLARDEQARDAAELTLTARLEEIDATIQDAAEDAREEHVWKTRPKVVDGTTQTRTVDRPVRVCSVCAAEKPPKTHFRVLKKKVNPCAGASVVEVLRPATEYFKVLPFKLSSTSLKRYQKTRRHTPVTDRDGKVVFDGNALKKLITRYPQDRLYPIIGTQRKVTKLRSTYVGVRDPETGRITGGMPMGPDGLGHPSFNHNPSTLRLSCAFFHQLPRPNKKDPQDLGNLIRNLVVAKPGHVFHARDFSGIEAVLVGYEAKSSRYLRLAKRDVHSYYTAYALHALDKRISANDLPQLDWPDERLFTRLEEIKAEFGYERNSLYKHLTHAINFGQGPKGAQEKIYKETGVLHPIPLIAQVMGVYKEIFSEIVDWQNAVRERAHADGYLRNAFGYVHRFSHVFRYTKEDGDWERKLGEDAEAVLAFLPQSNAAGIIKEALLRLYQQRFEEAGQYLRLQIHDELFLEVPEDQVAAVDDVLRTEMERPVEQMKMDWLGGEPLVVLTEPKTGKRWGEMK